MNALTSSSWHPRRGSLWNRIDDTLDRWADAVKDALLDWELDDDEWRTLPPETELPALDEEEFLAALRGRTEQALREVADVVNALPPGAGWQRGQQAVAAILAELTRDTFAAGLQLRIDTALRHQEVVQPAPGLWAARYRRMMLEDSAYPPEPPPQEDV
jgi:hypothetical protein